MSQLYQVYTLKMFSETSINYCYVIVDQSTRFAAVVDPSWEIDKINNVLNELEVKLKVILLTHSHDDHVNLVPLLVEKYAPKIYMSQPEKEFYNYECPSLFNFADSEHIQLGLTSITCLITPGHTVGSACFLLNNDIFTGDTIFIEGCGGCNSEGASPEQLFESIQRMKAMLSPDIRVYPGHSFGELPGQPMNRLLTLNIYFQLNKEDFVKFRMRKTKAYFVVSLRTNLVFKGDDYDDTYYFGT